MMLKHKGYIGRADWDDEAKIFHGEIANICTVVTFRAANAVQLVEAFRDSVEDYLASCREQRKKPEKPVSGPFVAAIDPDHQRQIRIIAARSGKSLYDWIAELLERERRQAHARSRKEAKAKKHQLPEAKVV